MRYLIAAGIVAIAAALIMWGSTANEDGKTVMQFSGQDAALEQAIMADDAPGVNAAISAGADANARGAMGVTPLAFAVGTGKMSAAKALIAAGANPNFEDDEGDTAVTLAVNRYGSEPAFLPMVLDAGGNPNQSRPDGDPVIVRFINGAAMTYFNIRIPGLPMTVVQADG
ncbi:MAG: ankyrin repeat domain-containing protein, partial [Pseudomonadota bacterium]